jgi:Uma2 family endonuclease
MSDAMTTITRRWTAADLEGLPDDGNRYELIDGELHVTSAPHVWHQVVVGNVAMALQVWSKQTAGGLTISGPGVIFSPTDAVIPDVVWVRRDRFPSLLGEDGKLHDAQILSSRCSRRERPTKCATA